jgi:hypothetical protein
MTPRKTGSESSKRTASIASKGAKHPESLTLKEIQTLAGAVLVQHEPPTVPVKKKPSKP